MVAPSKLLMGTTNEHATDVASLYQKRFVCIAEPEQNSKLREARVKELTGDCTIAARRMREDFWSYQRTHKFWMAVTQKTEESGRSRMGTIVPFHEGFTSNRIGTRVPVACCLPMARKQSKGGSTIVPFDDRSRLRKSDYEIRRIFRRSRPQI